MLKSIGTFLIGLGTALTALFVMVNLHEIGHTVLVRLLGDPDSVYYLVRIYPNGGMCLGCNIYEQQKLTWAGNLLVVIGGVMSTQTAAMAMIGFARYARLSWLRRLLFTTILVFLIDFPLQTAQAFRRGVANPADFTNVDFVDLTWRLHTRFNLLFVVLQLGLVILCLLYLTFVFF